MRKLTEAQRRALEWFIEHGPVGMFPFDGPSRKVRLNLERMGLIGITERKLGDFIKFDITPTGRSALAEGEKR